jgi:glycosyltransferase involved in cell wall biosynthesis
MIQRQTYKNIREWVIVEGSQKKSDADKNKENIKQFIAEIKPQVNFTINYIEHSGRKLGGLRNLGNESCNSEIIVCMDDDDYYPPERVEESVNKLTNSKCLIGGVSDVYLYDFFLDRLFKFKGFMEYHSTNNCMAYKKDFLLTHKHDPEIEVGEERSFTFEFTSPLVKFDSRKTIIAISHDFNTFNKRELCLGGTLGTLKTLDEIKEPITNYIQEDIFKRMKELYVIPEPSKYDIVYMIGGFTNNFDPKSQTLFDNERAIVKLSEYWALNKAKKVAVYGEFDNDITVNGVNYISWKKFPFHHVYKTVILFRSNGFLSTCPYPINAQLICWDVYDNFIHNDTLIQFWKLYGHKVNKIFLKSNFHRIEFNHYLGTIGKQQIEILPSGLRLVEFSSNPENIPRNPYRFCYTTYYDRGLEFIVNGIFSVIKKIEPRAELHIYSGIDLIVDQEYKKKMLQLFTTEGVCDHGAQPAEIIAREKHMSSFELYVSNIINEVDCISIRESILAGCIPLLANFGVFMEREGYKFDMNHEDPKVMQRVALFILQLMKDQNALNFAREDMRRRSTTLISWEQTAEIMFKKIN